MFRSILYSYLSNTNNCGVRTVCTAPYLYLHFFVCILCDTLFPVAPGQEHIPVILFILI